MKKRLTATILAIAMFLAILPATLFSASAETLSGTCGENLTWTLDVATGVLTISGTGAMTDYSESGVNFGLPSSPWNEYASNIRTVSVSEGVTSIGCNAFCRCDNVTAIDIPDGLTSIGAGAFSQCNKLTEITMPDSITYIGGGAFFRCSGLTKIGLSNSLTTIESRLFFGCSSLPAVTIPNSVESIGSGAFSNCTALTSITISDGIKKISNGAFENSGYSNEPTNWNNGLLYIGNYLVETKYDISGIVAIREGTRVIADSVFKEREQVTSVTIPEGVTTIPRSAFFGCFSLNSVTFPSSLITIEESAFTNCFALSSITIPHGVTSIGDYAFSVCPAITTVSLPNTLKFIGAGAFEMSPSVTDVYYAGTADEWKDVSGNDAFYAATIHFESVPSLDHTWNESERTNATCTEAGKIILVCTCGETKTEEISALGHNFSAWMETKAATCTDEGENRRGCTRCDFFETRETSALGHSYVNGVCSRCGAKDPDYKPTAPAIEFNDIPANAWYVDAVDFAVENGLMNGVGNGKFDPEGSMTRAMLVTVLWRYEGSPKKGTNSFADVSNGQWYTDAIAWAAAEGIVGGVGNGIFKPHGNITREQMATILFRYANKKGFDTSKRGDLSGFPDASKVSSYAKDALSWTVAEGIINGSDGYLLPQGDATRAQVSAILMRYIQNITEAK